MGVGKANFGNPYTRALPVLFSKYSTHLNEWTIAYVFL